MKIALVFWPRRGNVERAAEMIRKSQILPGIELFDAGNTTAPALSAYDLIILGGSTVGASTWEEATDSNLWNTFFRQLRLPEMKNKTYALFQLGDQVLYPDHFADGLGIFYRELSGNGGRIIGKWPVTGYEFTGSDGVIDGSFAGLVLDEDSQPEQTGTRIEKWLLQIKQELGL